MKACIHRGARQIGGTCIELESGGQRLVLDVGLPLDAEPSETLLPEIPGFRAPDESLLAVVISHPHQDHHGLARFLRPEVPLVIGPAAQRILEAASVFVPSGLTFANTVVLENRVPLQLGPFAVTPYLVDHSAYDAYALLVEADGSRLFYSGDLRGHGRKAGLFERLVRDPPADLDVLLLEGSTLGRTDTNRRFRSEVELEDDLVQVLRQTRGMVLVNASSQNIDRVVTTFRAAKQTGRQLIVDLYTAEILRATGNSKIPQGTWKGVRVFLPGFQREMVKRRRLVDLTRRYRANRIFPERLAAEAGRSVLLFRPSMAEDLVKADCLEGAHLVYSLWEGYLAKEQAAWLRPWAAEHSVAWSVLHTSGHASLADLQRLARALNAEKVVPVHTFQPERYPEYFDHVELHDDGTWWEIN